MSISRDIRKIADIFLRHYDEINYYIPAYLPPIKMDKFKKMLGIDEREEFIKELNKLAEQGLIRVIDVWVYPGYRSYEEIKRGLEKIKSKRLREELE